MIEQRRVAMDSDLPPSANNPDDSSEATHVAGNVSIGEGDFIGRDSSVYGDEVHGNKINVEIAGMTMPKWVSWLIALTIGILCIALIIYAVTTWMQIRSASSPASFSSSPKIKITSHHEGDDIPREIDVTGTSESIPEHMSMWLYQYTYYDKYFLYPITRQADGAWQAKGVMIGEPFPHDVGQIFKIGVLLATPKADAIIRKKVYDLDSLPEGIQKFDPIALRRK